MPLKEGDRGDVDEDILASFGVEAFAPHLNLNGLRGMLHDLGDYNSAEATNEADKAFDYVDD